MATRESTVLSVSGRQPAGSRQARRLRRDGQVLGVVYGGEGEPLSFQLPARDLRVALADAGAVLDLRVEGDAGGPVVIKELIRHPLTGNAVHIDLLRVRLDVKIQATVALELTGTEEAPGVVDGGVLEHVTRELTIEALPNDIPDSLSYDVSEMQIGDTAMLETLRPPAQIEFLDDPETVLATLTPPRLQVEDEDEIESETEVVGEGEEREDAAPDAEAADEPESSE